MQVAKANRALSVANFNAALAVPAALGLDPSAARSHSVLSLICMNRNLVNSSCMLISFIASFSKLTLFVKRHFIPSNSDVEQLAGSSSSCTGVKMVLRFGLQNYSWSYK